jgi:hypothetical protein
MNMKLDNRLSRKYFILIYSIVIIISSIQCQFITNIVSNNSISTLNVNSQATNIYSNQDFIGINGMKLDINSVEKKSIYNENIPPNPVDDTYLIIQVIPDGIVKMEDFLSVNWLIELYIVDENQRESKLDKMEDNPSINTPENLENASFVFIVSKTSNHLKLYYSNGKPIPIQTNN